MCVCGTCRACGFVLVVILGLALAPLFVIVALTLALPGSLRTRLLGAGLGYMPMLTILDVSSNCLESLEFLGVLPALRELYLNANMLTSLDDLPTIPTLEVLSVCQNDIDSFRYMQTQPNLRALFLSYNRIVSLDGLPPFPLLESIRVTGNPIEQNEQFVLTFLIACGDELRKLNGQEVRCADWALDCHFFCVFPFPVCTILFAPLFVLWN